MLKQQLIDYFKLFKIYDLKKLQKTGQVKILQDKTLMRKILSVEGTVSTQNFTTLLCSNHPNILFKHQYLYMQAFCDPGKSFTFQITYFLSSKQYKIICSTMYKDDFKKKADNLFHFRLKMPSDKWTILAVDLYSLVNWDQSFKNDQDLRLGFRVASIEIRATSKVRGMFQSDSLYGPQNLPKDMQFALRGEENFFEKYAFVVTGLNMTEELKNQIVKMKENMQANEGEANKEEMPKGKLSKEKSQQKSQKNIEKKNLSREKGRLSEEKAKEQRKPIVPKGTKTQKGKKHSAHEVHNQQQLTAMEPDDQMMEQQMLQPPKPAASLNMRISAVEGLSLVQEDIVTCESFLIQPVMLATHKKIVKVCKSRFSKVLVAYSDGSVCLWDTIRKEPGFYFRSQLQEIKCLLSDYEGNIIIVGLDKLKRQVIEIVSNQAIIFKQISTFNIKTIKLVSDQSFELGLVSIGYENIRLWTISPNNHLINGYSVYLGKMARNVTYQDCCIVETMVGTYAFVCDSEGYVTKVNVNDKKMEGVVKVDNSGLDHIRLVKYINAEQKILVVNQKGTVKLLNCTTMDSQLQYPLNSRIKTLWLKQNPQNDPVPNLLLESYTKTIAELDLLTSTLHYNTRSHYQQVTHIQYEKAKSKHSSLFEDKIVTASSDSTMRVWKLIKTSETDVVLKEEYEFLINGETISHICVSPGNSKAAQGFVYMVTDSNKIRKISMGSYQIVKEKMVPSLGESNTKPAKTEVLSVSMNAQGKVLLIVCSSQLLIMDQELQVVHFKSLSPDNSTVKKPSKKPTSTTNQQTHLSGFNGHKKSLYFYNPHTEAVEFYQLKDLDTLMFSIASPDEEMVIDLEWDNDIVHCITREEYQLYERGTLLRVLPFKNHHHLIGKNHVNINCISMSFPMLCISYQLPQTAQNFITLQVLNRPGLSQKIKLPETVSQLQLTKPLNLSTQNQGYGIKDDKNTWQGQIICAGQQSHSMYAVNYTILNMPEVVEFNSQEHEPIIESQRTMSFIEQKSQRNMRIPKIQNANISFITHAKDEPHNNLDISFSETATLLLGNNFASNSNVRGNDSHGRNNFMGIHDDKIAQGPPAQLRRLYEEEEKVFEQCKKAVFGNFFDKDEDNEQLEENDCEEECEGGEEEERGPESGKVRMKIFYGVDARQSLVSDMEPSVKKQSFQKKKSELSEKVGSFHWSSLQNQTTLLTNHHKSLLIHSFTQPSISQRLIHLYSKPTSICWSHSSNSTHQTNICYYIVCYNSIIKLYNAGNGMSYVRSIENEGLVKDRHVVFDSFVTSCNGFLVLLTYRLQQGANSRLLQGANQSPTNKLFIFVLQLSSGKIVTSSYRQIPKPKHKQSNSTHHLQHSYHLLPNRYSQNNQLEFILISQNSVSFYRVTSMFTLQTLQLDEINLLTKEKTQNLLTAVYAKIQHDVYLLIATENGSVIIVDARSGTVLLLLLHLLAGKAHGKNQPITSIQFIDQGPYIDGESTSCSKLIFTTKSSNSLLIFHLINGLNSLIQQVEQTSTTIPSSNQSLSQNQSLSYSQLPHNQSSLQCINLDSEITSISTINNSTQQLVLTKSCTLWLVDYDDMCSVKIFAAHSEHINEAWLLGRTSHGAQSSSYENKQKPALHFITCSQDGSVKISDTNKLEQQVQVYKPRKPANCLEVSGNFTVCGFEEEVYFYDGLREDVSQFLYLGSLQFENQTVLKVRNIPTSDNYYILTSVKLYVIFVKRKTHSNALNKSNATGYLSTKPLNTSHLSKSSLSLPKVHIEIEIHSITTFPQKQHPLWLEINPHRPYDQFALGFKPGKVDTWQRKCLKRTLNPLEQLSHVQSLQYYLTDVYHRKQTIHPHIQFISQREYLIAHSELNLIELRNYHDHSILNQISFSTQFLQGISAFKYFVLPEKPNSNSNKSSLQHHQAKIQGVSYFNHMGSLKKGPLILIGDQFGYLSVCDMNGLVIEKEKVFNSPIQSIEVYPEMQSNKMAFQVFVKSSHFVSLLAVYH